MRWIVPLLLVTAPIAALHAASADRVNYVLLTGSDGSAMMSGSTDDIRRARALQSGNAPLLYVRQDGVAYVIRDATMLRRAEAIMEPQRKLGERQGELGDKQGELGRQQGALGAEQGRLGAQMANSTPRQMGELGRQQGELGRRQAALGEQQAALGRAQGALGKMQARLAERAQPQFRALVSEAIRKGLAQRVD
jgi:hypothetical protein